MTVRPPRRPTILVVDDEPPNCELLTRLLSPHGYTVESVGDGEAALDALGKQPPWKQPSGQTLE